MSHHRQPCITSRACGAFRGNIIYNDLSTKMATYDYCPNMPQQDFKDRCKDCLHQMGSDHTLSNCRRPASFRLWVIWLTPHSLHNSYSRLRRTIRCSHHSRRLIILRRIRKCYPRRRRRTSQVRTKRRRTNRSRDQDWHRRRLRSYRTRNHRRHHCLLRQTSSSQGS